RAEGAGDPHFGRGPMAAGIAFGIHSNPIGMSLLNVVVSGMGIGAGEDDHSEFAASGDELAEGVVRAEPGTAMMEGNLGGIIGDATAGAQANGVGLGAAKIIEPELG